jgi:predicted small lipoprotein YifL
LREREYAIDMNRFSALLAVGLVALLAGCGDTGPNEFADQVEEVMKPVEQAATSSADPAKIDKFADALDDAAQKLRDLDPPDGSEDELEATVKAIERGADNFREASSALASGNQEALTKVSKDLKTSLDEISETGQALETSVNN